MEITLLVPKRAKKVCKKAGCSNLHTNPNGYCDEHQLKRERTEDNRPNSNERGYDYRWQNFARRYLKNNPVCVRCGRPAEVVDHIIPLQIMKEIYGGNTFRKEHYQSLCVRCNNLKGKNEDKKAIEEFFKDAPPTVHGAEKKVQKV